MPRAQALPSPLSSVVFLVVDDNANMVAILRTVLKSFGAMHILEAGSAADALALARQYEVDVALVDYNLGGPDGIEFVRQIRAGEEGAKRLMPIVMVTAYTEQHLVEAARDAGVTEFCAKPVTGLGLYRKLVEVIERPRPFVRAGAYFGPDRRRRSSGETGYQGPDRRQATLAPA